MNVFSCIGVFGLLASGLMYMEPSKMNFIGLFLFFITFLIVGFYFEYKIDKKIDLNKLLHVNYEDITNE